MPLILNNISEDDLINSSEADLGFSLLYAMEGGSATLDPSELRDGLLTDGELNASLVVAGFAGGIAYASDIKPGLLDADGDFKPSMLDADGNLKATWRKAN